MIYMVYRTSQLIFEALLKGLAREFFKLPFFFFILRWVVILIAIRKIYLSKY